jgi:hypothetical protein
MLRFILAWIISTAVCLAASSDSPLGTWATQIVGKDHGICYLTFSNDMSVAGYGISLDALGPFDLAGHWLLDGKGRLVGSFSQFIQGGGAGAKFRGKAHNDKLRVHVNSTAGGFNFKGEPAHDIADLTGPWNAKVKQNGKPFFVAFDAVLSTNVPAWFEISGNGVNDTGSFTLSGGILITPDNRAAAYTVYDYGTSVETNAFVGKLVKRGKKLVLRGRTDNNQPATLRAERP